MSDRKLYQTSGDPPMRWRNCIRPMREKRGMTQQQLAEATGMKQGNIAATERHNREPSVGTLLRIAKALDCTVDDLIELEDGGPMERFISRCGNLRPYPLTEEEGDE